MTHTSGPFVGIAPRPGAIAVVLLDAPGRDGPLRFSVSAPAGAGGGPVRQRLMEGDRAAQAAVRRIGRIAGCDDAGAHPPACHIALLGYIARPRRQGALLINELGALARLRLSEAGLAWFEVAPLWLARFVSDADEGRAAAVWAALDAGQTGLTGGAGSYGWAAALAHVARCAAAPRRYAPWQRALARELARWG